MSNKKISHTIRELNSTEYDLWDNLVTTSPLGTVFHESFWLKTCRDNYNANLHLYGCFNDNNYLVAGCPLFEKKKYGLKYGSAILNESMIPYGGFLYRSEECDNVRKKEQDLQEKVNAFHEFFEEQKFDLIKMILPPGLIDIRPFLKKKWQENILYTYRLNPKIKKYQKGMRGNIKKAIQQGIKIEMYEHEDGITKFYSLLKETYQRHGISIPCSEQYIKNIYDYLKEKDRINLWVAITKEGEWSAAEIFVNDNNCPHRWTAATSTKHIKTESSSLLLETIFDKYANKNIEDINLMAGNISELSSFIGGFNPDLSIYFQIEYTSRGYQIFNHIKNGILISKK